MDYTITVKTKLSFHSAETEVTNLLKEKGFGIISRIDMRETLMKKTGKDCGNYLILGACNPGLAFRSISANKLMGVFLPCNFIIFEDNDSVTVSAINPRMMSSVFSNGEIEEIGTIVTAIFDEVLSKIKE